MTADDTVTERDEARHGGQFATTHWSVVLSAGGSHGPDAKAALETLCSTYWHPLYVYARRRGYSPQDAEDMTQAFLAHLLQHDAFATADPERGRFRSFLLAGMNHFLSDQWDRARAQKRGGGKVIPMDLQSAETWMGALASSDATPEEAFERRWAVSLLEEVYRRLEETYRAKGRAEVFDALRATLTGPREAAPYAELAAQLEMNEGAVKVAVHRLRRDYRELLRLTIADLVADPGDVEDELCYLKQVLSR